MSLQGDLFLPMAKSRRADPSTSRQAARATEATGRAAGQRAACLAEVQRLTGQTAAEIAVAVGLERHVPSRRLPELRDLGLVANGAGRECLVTGNRSMTWHPKDSTA